VLWFLSNIEIATDGESSDLNPKDDELASKL
jgi:hypothetical protein